MTGSGNKDQILKIAKPGAYIGLQTILGDKVNHYSATAINDCLACFMNIRIFKELIKKNSLFAYELIIYICKEELNYFHRFVDQNQKQLNGRVADAMIMFSSEIFESLDFELPFTKSDLAALVGSTRESVTRILKEFNDSNIMNMKGRKIQILDEERLKRISLAG
jgi:CRP/FNR family transcriptional regulator